MTATYIPLELELPTTFADALRAAGEASGHSGLEASAIAALKFYAKLTPETLQKLQKVRYVEGLATADALIHVLDYYLDTAHKQAPEDVRAVLRPRAGREERVQRDARIMELKAQRMSNARIGVEVNLSAIRVAQIVASERAKEEQNSKVRDTENT